MTQKADQFQELNGVRKEMTEIKDKVQNLQQILITNNDRLISEIQKSMMPHVEELIKKKIQEHNVEQDKKYED